MLTVTVEAVARPLRVRTLAGEFLLRPGEPHGFSAREARALLKKAPPGRVRVVEVPAGAWILYQSPQFGEMTAEVLAVPGNGFITIYQPLVRAVVSIPLAWVLGMVDPKESHE